MSLTARAIGAAKKIKRRYAGRLRAKTPVYISPVRRIERVAAPERVCAMTFDDGPCRLPASPDRFDGAALTEVLAQTLERYGAKGTFDVVGSTAGNYPDRAGKEGSAAWGGVRYDHYPDFGRDADGGAENCPELIERLLAGGHELTSHTYAHVLFGRKRLVYGRRAFQPGLEPVLEDLRRLHTLAQSRWGYTMRLSRPPHYVDGIRGGFTSYDAYALMGYQYLAASFDGAGWLPLAGGYEAETEAVWQPVQAALAADGDFFRGQIIFQKDGFNMARRSPIADGLEKQLALLTARGYRVVTVSELLDMAPFRDEGPDTEACQAARKLMERGWSPAFRDNTLRPDTPLTRGALAMMAYGWPGAVRRTELMREGRAPFGDVPARHPYAGAAALAAESGALAAENGLFRLAEPVTERALARFMETVTGRPVSGGASTHGRLLRLAAENIQ